MRIVETRLSGWGGTPARGCRIIEPRDDAQLAEALAIGPVIARGSGLAYGDSALGTGLTLSTGRMTRLLAFDDETGALDLEAGVPLRDIVDIFGRRGWFPPVVPGTAGVTVGGMIAADVHGKSHRADGSFGAHVRWLDLMDAEGQVRRLNPDDPLFAETLGGMGLTGIVLRAGMTLRPVQTGWMRQQTRILPDPQTALATLEESGGWRFSIAWIDMLSNPPGRALVYRGEHAGPADLGPGTAPFPPLRQRYPAVPFTPPVSLVRQPLVRAFNARHYRAATRGPHETLVGWQPFFFPLDHLGHWNRLYGRRGLLQYQTVVPLAEAEAALTRTLDTCRTEGPLPWLVTLKRFGASAGGLSFPMEGYSLALDFPATPAAFALLDRLDRITLDHGGRFYLAKDARLLRSVFDAAEPRAEAFRALRRETGADRRFVSAQSERLGL